MTCVVFWEILRKNVVLFQKYAEIDLKQKMF